MLETKSVHTQLYVHVRMLYSYLIISSLKLSNPLHVRGDVPLITSY